MKSLLVRADASTQIGTGHVMRCLALAQAWQDDGRAATFVSSETLGQGLEKRLHDEAMDLHLLKAEPGSAQDAVQTAALAHGINAQWVVIDGYHFGTDYQQVIKDAGLRLLCIDDYGHAGEYVADIVLNQNCYAGEALYPTTNEEGDLLLGSRYVLLRRDFLRWRGWQRAIPEAGRCLLVTLGGSDPSNSTEKVLAALANIVIENIETRVVIGGSNPRQYEYWRHPGRYSPNIHFLQNVSDMPDLMAWSDLAVTAGGTTLWELTFMGLPALVGIAAENQVRSVTELADEGAIQSLGWYADITPSDLADCIATLMFDPQRRRSMSERGRSLIDGNGGLRVLKRMRRWMLHLRDATMDDCLRVWEWANEAETRAMSFSLEQIPWDTHIEWFLSRLDDPSTWLFIALDEDEQPVGQVRLESTSGEEATISLSVDIRHRGKGYGSRIIELATRYMFLETDRMCIIAYVKPANLASIHAFETAGYRQTGEVIVKGQNAAVFARFRDE